MTAPKISLVVAVAQNGIIGRGGALPWRVRGDMKRFRAVTMGKPIIMGRRTWESLNGPLAGRSNLVVTRQEGYEAPGALTASSFDAAVSLAEDEAERLDADEICVIGGAEIFAEALPRASLLHWTEIAAEPEGDVAFPPFERTQWQEISCDRLPTHEGDTAEAVYRLLERR
ncbi:dihydrofolate reductase [Afifella marina]|uniref:Dihydrofolate reductase n=1 Tax=Afifella marina DSM 2698 TaxID=1120955 RepID=A0A1G5N662_AFIMA|nr:dihydrofolate reductase [Afifella marina]MBK1622443.1 dihydrofolate reductase [Afifella marina DSM 2698]MBK1626843.1 dihydrofolate reductase [Afifella marina]MBK5919227.1 dihydrofolate reductase [Afifella marina]RAI21269.1 dihydrofolate reductase [Afifella marina DSM 2698]SCZ32160.1 dihydrofolate reductase [Afifella marina DSM 2698]